MPKCGSERGFTLNVWLGYEYCTKNEVFHYGFLNTQLTRVWWNLLNKSSMENFIFCAVGLIKARLLSWNIPMTSEVWVSESSLFLSIIAEEKKHFQKNYVVSSV